MALTDFNEVLNYVEKKKVPDGLGGWTTEYVKGAEFFGVFQRQGTSEQILATQRGLNEAWVLIVNKNIDLNLNDIIEYNGDRFRIATNELTSPKVSTIKVNQYQAERIIL